ncbi:hypothetical protein LZ198_11095 [Myxococcus sp. K15C18031901]|uniref:hypothetical protein n=1 Tax=Myxococcus dinghuensis TaxID=2906761 RepID=UPI0020A75D56|nr:hypothetical protein [Myxococcus dinghuensis]MCP3099415.1 hypothetical protein [Myxococcus dinghuensis]
MPAEPFNLPASEARAPKPPRRARPSSRRALGLCSALLITIAVVLTLGARQGHLSHLLLIIALVCAVLGALLFGYQVLTDVGPSHREPRARSGRRPPPVTPR